MKKPNYKAGDWVKLKNHQAIVKIKLVHESLKTNSVIYLFETSIWSLKNHRAVSTCYEIDIECQVDVPLITESK